MNAEEQRKQMVAYWWKKAELSLEAAEREFIAGAYDFVINRVYYAAFYAVSAALLERRLSFKKHSGVRANFHKEFIKKGLLEVKWGKFYDHVFEDRQESDYTAFVEFEKEYVEEQLNNCKEFLNKIKSLITSL